MALTADSDLLLVDEIVVDERRREDFGDLAALSRSIDRYGLLHPLVVDDDNHLIAGERRLRACRLLEWTHVLVRRLGDISEHERREIELEENLRRKDLTPYEQAKVIAERAVLAGEIARQAELRGEFPQNSKRGRHPKAGSTRDVAERLGVDKKAVDNAHQHVATADAYPFMQSWPQYNVLEARTHLETLPEAERPEAVALVAQPGLPAKEACQMLHTIAARPANERAHLYELNRSADDRARSRAITEALGAPPMPDPRVIWLDVDVIKRGQKYLRTYPRDPLNTQLQALMADARSLAAAIAKGAPP